MSLYNYYIANSKGYKAAQNTLDTCMLKASSLKLKASLRVYGDIREDKKGEAYYVSL